ncbi:MAG: hypothetical protein AB2L09_12790 [Coriobacteriia bacterium]
MTLYYERQGWGVYTTDHEVDRAPYPDDWARIQHEAGCAIGDDEWLD